MQTIFYLLTLRTRKALSLVLAKKFSIYVIIIPILSFLLLNISASFMLSSEWEQMAEKQIFIINLVKRTLVQSLTLLLIFSTLYWLFNRLLRHNNSFKKNFTVVSYSSAPFILGSIIIILSKFILANVDDYMPYVGWDEYGYTIVNYLSIIWAFIIAFTGNRIVTNARWFVTFVPTIILIVLVTSFKLLMHS